MLDMSELEENSGRQINQESSALLYMRREQSNFHYSNRHGR